MTKFTQSTNAVAKLARNAVENFTQGKNTTLNLAFCLAKKLNFICGKMASFAQNTNAVAGFFQSKNSAQNESIKIKFMAQLNLTGFSLINFSKF